jgi:hypothetical protein
MLAPAIKCLCLGLDPQKWNPVLRPIALYIIEERMMFSPGANA